VKPLRRRGSKGPELFHFIPLKQLLRENVSRQLSYITVGKELSEALNVNWSMDSLVDWTVIQSKKSRYGPAFMR
jgi:hypothetical protein